MIEAMRPALQRMCSAAVRREPETPIEASDLLSETYLALWANRHRIGSADRPQALAQTIAARAVGKALAAARKAPQTLDGDLARALTN